MRFDKIISRYKGFVPASRPHRILQCAYYHCPEVRLDGRHCKQHADQYLTEVQAQGGAHVIALSGPNSTDPT